MSRYLTDANVAARITWQTISDVFDDERDGNWQGNLEEFKLDAESEVEQSIAKTYGEAGFAWLRAQGTSCPRACKRIALDVFEWRMGTRHPSYTNAAAWQKKRDKADADLKMLRLRDVELDTIGEPEPAQNEGGIVESGDPDDIEPKPKMFVDGMGDFWSNC